MVSGRGRPSWFYLDLLTDFAKKKQKAFGITFIYTYGVLKQLHVLPEWILGTNRKSFPSQQQPKNKVDITQVIVSSLPVCVVGSVQASVLGSNGWACVCVLSESQRGHISLSESYKVEHNQPHGRSYHFQHYLTLHL